MHVLNNIHSYKTEKAIYLKYYITRSEHKEITNTLGDAGVLLYMHYLRMASTKQPDLSDENTCSSLHWNLRKVQRYRTGLAKAGFYKLARYTRSDGTKGIDHYLGKDAVAELDRNISK